MQLRREGMAVKVVTHNYAGTRNFEQSLDIYTPENASRDLPLVVIVVGSAWMGHRWNIYAPCAWWNASGPASIAKCGCVCVCVRHRGAFVQPPPIELLIMVLAMYVIWAAFPLVAKPLLMILVLGVALHALAYGAASHEDMLDDVSRAIAWVRTHRSTLATPDQRLVFGGYSSGAHVAATLLTRPGLLSARGVPAPTEWCDGVLLLSGVLGVRPGPPLPPPGASWARVAPNLIVRLAFGSAAASALPSPVHIIDKQPHLPHLLIYCKHELFNLQPLEREMGTMFCSEAYGELLAARNVSAMLLPVESDHWSVLSSKGFAQALQTAFIERKWPPGKSATPQSKS